MNPSKLNPVAEAPIEIGSHGNVLGDKFYLGLQYKRIRGKNRVRGVRRDHYSGEQLGRYTPSQWQSMTEEQRQQHNFTSEKSN